MTATETWFDAVARTAATIEGIKGGLAYAAGTGGQGVTVRPIPRSLPDTPAAVLYYRGARVTTGSGLFRLTHTVQLRIYIPRTDLGAAIGELVKYPARVMAAFRVRGQAFGTADAVTVNNFLGVETEEWPPRAAYESESAGKWYLVLPVELEVVETIYLTTLAQ